MPKNPAPEDSVRLDQWLHAVRLYKTRALAARAIKAQRVLLNEQYVKASRPLRVGDMLRVTRADERMELRVTGLCTRRVGAKVAAALYEETAQSAAARVAAAELKRMAWRSTPRPASRPNKRDRRRLIRFVRAAGEGEAAGKGDDEDA